MDPWIAEVALGTLLGVALAASAGFRVFVPLFVASLAIWSGHLEVADGWAWLGTPVALGMLGVATTVEILAAKIPWVDNALDLLAIPGAVVAGTLLTAAFVTELSPLMQWSLAIIAGGGAAGTVSATMAGVRLASTTITGGVANPILAIGETGSSVVTAVLAVVAPILALLFVVALVVGAVVWYVGAEIFVDGAA